MNSEKNYKKTTKNNSVVLVGNGGSLLNSNKGAAINSFIDVVRFNNFRINGYEADVGTKTTIWFTVNCNLAKLKGKYKKVYFHSWEWNRSKTKCYYTLLGAFPELLNTQRTDCIEIKKKLPSYPHMAFSTGLIAIHILLKEYEHLHLVGFDWHLDKYPHHYADTEPRGHLHNAQLEWKYISRLNRMGKITFL